MTKITSYHNTTIKYKIRIKMKTKRKTATLINQLISEDSFHIISDSYQYQQRISHSAGRLHICNCLFMVFFFQSTTRMYLLNLTGLNLNLLLGLAYFLEEAFLVKQGIWQ